jgi:hypothetical protein
MFIVVSLYIVMTQSGNFWIRPRRNVTNVALCFVKRFAYPDRFQIKVLDPNEARLYYVTVVCVYVCVCVCVCIK